MDWTNASALQRSFDTKTVFLTIIARKKCNAILLQMLKCNRSYVGCVRVAGSCARAFDIDVDEFKTSLLCAIQFNAGQSKF